MKFTFKRKSKGGNSAPDDQTSDAVPAKASRTRRQVESWWPAFYFMGGLTMLFTGLAIGSGVAGQSSLVLPCVYGAVATCVMTMFVAVIGQAKGML